MSEPGAAPASEDPEASAAPIPVWRRIGVDWWAVLVAGVFVLLAVADVLPTIPW
ncbi:hypothetical protein [Nocardia wallacei]|uniref:Uncharacterized protein n=1 Tax=Nocardia wallacei TaxID=480035 RepID=A0A7G1KVX6_9NOCA|nr:hypothetical protein [Nocardia wallacei]BCK59232.1 hypothetical protein NWFMUON74_70040 [Nocardia wallacei]